MSMTALLVDTSYLLELLKVPDRFDPEFAEQVKKRFSGAVKAGHRLYVPFLVVFEVANHIAGVRDGARARSSRSSWRRRCGAASSPPPPGSSPRPPRTSSTT